MEIRKGLMGKQQEVGWDGLFSLEPVVKHWVKLAVLSVLMLLVADSTPKQCGYVVVSNPSSFWLIPASLPGLFTPDVVGTLLVRVTAY